MAKPPPLPRIAREPTSPLPNLGRRRYRINHRVGRWIVGSVYAGEEVASGTPVTVLFPDLVAAEVDHFLTTIRDEVARNRLLVGLPISGFQYVGQTLDHRVFCVLPDSSGTTMEMFIRDRGAPQPVAALQLAVLLADGLMRLHYRSRYLGELRPWTVLLPSDRSEQLDVLDLGIPRGLFDATISAPSPSPNFASPNVRAGGELGVADDIYTLGALLYYALCGEPPPPDGPYSPSLRRKLGPFSSFLDGVVVQAMAPDPKRGIAPLPDMLTFSRSLRGLRDLHRLTPDGQRAVLMLRAEGRGVRPPPVPGAALDPADTLGFVEDGPAVLTPEEIESIEERTLTDLKG